jgi:hypothetical protein
MLLNCAMAANTNVQIKLYLLLLFYFALFLHSVFNNPCQSNPCQHGGSCLPFISSPGYECDCPSSFSGPNCEGEYGHLWNIVVYVNYVNVFLLFSLYCVLLLACCTSVYYQSVIKDLISFELCVLLHDYNAYFDEIHFFS